MTEITATSTDAPTEASARGLLAIVLTGVFIATLDVAIANVAAPRIGTDLHATGADLQLVVAGYMITYAVLIVTCARLGDLAGRRNMFLAGVALFTLASLACGVAWAAVPLIVFRFVQGAGAALMVPQVLSLIQLHFKDGARAKALSTYAAVIACGAIAGQIVGGVLVNADLWGSQWRPVFLVNVPIGLVLLVAGARALPKDNGHPGRRLDLPGLATLSLAVFALVLPLVLGHQLGWPTWTWVSLALCAVFVALFVLVERRASRTGGSPLIRGDLLRAPGMLVGASGLLAATANYAGILFLITLYVQEGLGHGALVAAMVFLPSAVAFGFASLSWRKLPAAWHRSLAPAGLGLTTLAFLGLALTMRGGHISVWMELCILCFGLGMGTAFSPMFTIAFSKVPPIYAADASGVLTTVNQLGQVIGVAVYGSVFLSLFHTPSDAPHAALVTTLVMACGSVFGSLISLGLPRNTPKGA
ncbi:MFS transporter [Actinospica durhamensis]|uniref:MFS transporter n=1 Tax=Actinospica durhamensis TaxID=1508375 RepID=A0A941EM72_9ACTN|nr:MFS transporter [Actinospica durhamensis]MBR7833530.1 MFS transporter [Actinospica durhamensis]